MSCLRCEAGIWQQARQRRGGRRWGNDQEFGACLVGTLLPGAQESGKKVIAFGKGQLLCASFGLRSAGEKQNCPPVRHCD